MSHISFPAKTRLINATSFDDGPLSSQMCNTGQLGILANGRLTSQTLGLSQTTGLAPRKWAQSCLFRHADRSGLAAGYPGTRGARDCGSWLRELRALEGHSPARERDRDQGGRPQLRGRSERVLRSGERGSHERDLPGSRGLARIRGG